MDPVPTRFERLAAVVAILAALLVVPAAALGSGIAVVVLLFVAFTCGTIANARVGIRGLATFGGRSRTTIPTQSDTASDGSERTPGSRRLPWPSSIHSSSGC
ncbi:hypothetical protein C491_00210 [Natronococcus amylolyticus DSM 10524]|uniref:Uncharacterized protein n=1 Tax=Natronococcus amylolyticus DSM 10524 TaxID=1227497 RepID=L9XJ06_9EURY|nr:hypothetical protein [Natronococcus amylolyticus]ELY61700.1 hypothetical protein C491_00210 [Natronococcus amylolyticus DSM 10524]